MKIAFCITRACAALLFALLANSATAQTAPTPLMLPATDKVVVDTCFVLWARHAGVRPERPVQGKDFWPIRKENLPVPGDADKVLGVFSEDMAKGGFTVDIPLTCDKMADDPKGRITARLVFGVSPPAPGKGTLPIVQTDSFLKVPGESRAVYVPARNLGNPEEVAASIAQAMKKAIGEAQPKPVAPEVKTN